MRALDILAVVSGVTGIAFALMMLDRFSQWRRYLAPVSAFLIGYALSVVSMLLPLHGHGSISRALLAYHNHHLGFC